MPHPSIPSAEANAGSGPVTDETSSSAETPVPMPLQATTAMAALMGALALTHGIPVPVAHNDDWLGPERIEFDWPPPPAARAFMSGSRRLREALGRPDFQMLQRADYSDPEIDAALILVARQGSRRPYGGGVHGHFGPDRTFWLGSYERVACCRGLSDPTAKHPHGHARHAKTPEHMACLLQVDQTRLERLAKVIKGLQSTSNHQRMEVLLLLRDDGPV